MSHAVKYSSNEALLWVKIITALTIYAHYRIKSSLGYAEKNIKCHVIVVN